ncbi:MAG TPA: hypothetical protein PLK15_06350 [Chitinophagales bacterium]|jgi:hypothetical protein|nr:hypothetical protein [Chitinophagales bacterium]
MNTYLNRYLRISFINLCIVAALGSIMRYKIAFSLPFLDQKHLLHAHSHFAFVGWISQTLMVLLIQYLSSKSGEDKFIPYRKILIANLVAAYGMLVSFPVQGYGVISITFSTLSEFVFYYFAYCYWRDLNKLKEQSIVHQWFKVGLFLGVLSSIGTFALAYMMVNKVVHQNWYLAAIYFYLHFQYNGWFFFACIGLLYSMLPENIRNSKELKNVFLLFAFASIPAYFLSTLWLPLPSWLFVIIIIASIAQVGAWLMMLKVFYTKNELIAQNVSLTGKWLMALSGLALTVKLCLQLGSNIPALSKLAFGFRPIVIAYLHLVLLGVITLFLLGYIFASPTYKIPKGTFYGIIIFVAGIILNEAVLMIQGVASFSYTPIPYINVALLLVALTLFLGSLLLAASRYNTTK